MRASECVRPDRKGKTYGERKKSRKMKSFSRLTVNDNASCELDMIIMSVQSSRRSFRMQTIFRQFRLFFHSLTKIHGSRRFPWKEEYKYLQPFEIFPISLPFFQGEKNVCGKVSQIKMEFKRILDCESEKETFRFIEGNNWNNLPEKVSFPPVGGCLLETAEIMRFELFFLASPAMR